MLQLLDERICRIEKDVEALNGSNGGNKGLKVTPQGPAGTVAGAHQEMEPFADEDHNVHPPGADVKASESNTRSD